MKHNKLPVLATLAVIGLAAVPAFAGSLTLNDGDAVTVDSTGTHGTVNTAATSYDDSGGSGVAVQTNGTATFTLGAGGFIAAATHGNKGLVALGSGVVTISGGTIMGGPVTGGTGGSGTAMTAGGTGTVAISGGTFTAGSVAGSGSVGLLVSGSSPVTITGGAFTGVNALGVPGNGTVTISGGTFTTSTNGITLYAGLTGASAPTVIITGGTFTTNSSAFSEGVGANKGSTVTIAGGNFTGWLANGYGFDVHSGGIINLFSQGDTPFLVKGVSMNNTTIPFATSGPISGTLLNGDLLNTSYLDTSTINLNVGTPPVIAPEPSPAIALAIGLIGLGALTLRARRRSITCR